VVVPRYDEVPKTDSLEFAEVGGCTVGWVFEIQGDEMMRKRTGMTQCGNRLTDCKWFHWWKTQVKTETVTQKVCRWCGAKKSIFYEPTLPTWDGDDTPILSEE